MKNAIILLLFVATIACAETVFVDNQPGVINGSTAYDPETRTCGQGSHKVFTKLDQGARALSQADTLYLRAGVYGRDSVGEYIEVHGNKVNYWTGAMAITATGSARKRKLVSAYRGDVVIIQATPGTSHYNPDPADTSCRNSSHYYRHPAISISGSFLNVRGLKTYGQAVISGHDIVLEDCDLGGGGPHMNQGQVIVLNSNNPGSMATVFRQGPPFGLERPSIRQSIGIKARRFQTHDRSARISGRSRQRPRQRLRGLYHRTRNHRIAAPRIALDFVHSDPLTSTWIS